MLPFYILYEIQNNENRFFRFVLKSNHPLYTDLHQSQRDYFGGIHLIEWTVDSRNSRKNQWREQSR